MSFEIHNYPSFDFEAHRFLNTAWTFISEPFEISQCFFTTKERCLGINLMYNSGNNQNYYKYSAGFLYVSILNVRNIESKEVDTLNCDTAAGNLK